MKGLRKGATEPSRTSDFDSGTTLNPYKHAFKSVSVRSVIETGPTPASGNMAPLPFSVSKLAGQACLIVRIKMEMRMRMKRRRRMGVSVSCSVCRGSFTHCSLGWMPLSDYSFMQVVN